MFKRKSLNSEADIHLNPDSTVSYWLTLAGHFKVPGSQFLIYKMKAISVLILKVVVKSKQDNE